MIGSLPPKPQGSSREALFMQWLWDKEFSMRAVDVPGALVHRTTRGVAIIPRPGKGGTAAPATPANLQAFIIKSVEAEWIVGTPMGSDGMPHGGDTMIAKESATAGHIPSHHLE